MYPRAMTDEKSANTLAAALGERITAARKAASISQKKLAERIGKGQGTLGHYEAGRVTPPLDALVGIADATNTTPAFLLGDTEFGILNAFDIEILRRWRRLNGGQKFQLIGLINTHFPDEPSADQ
jgi:transcriptional regulator with XRE-family HTH domain